MPHWIQVDVECPKGLAAILQQHLFDLGAAGCEEGFISGETPPPRQPWDTGPPLPLPARRVIRAWFEIRDGTPIVNKLNAALGRNKEDVQIIWAPYTPVDWEAEFRKQHPPIHISQRLTIAPPWHASPSTLVIEPGIGFGTGSHPTTLQALRALDAHADSCQTALDVGCGSGILALAAAKLGLTAWGFDIEEDAVKSAIRHAETNSLNVQFSTKPLKEWTGPYDMVLANLHAELLLDMHEKLVQLTGKTLITAGIMAEKAEPVLRLFRPHFQHAHRSIDGDWVSWVFTVRAEEI